MRPDRAEVLASAARAIVAPDTTPVCALLATDREDSQRAYEEIVERVRRELGPDRAGVLGHFRAAYPPRGRRFEFGTQHNRMMLQAAGPEVRAAAARWDLYNRRAWPGAKIIVIGNADAFARAGRSGPGWTRLVAGHVLALSEHTPMRQVLVGTGELVRVLDSTPALRDRSRCFELAPGHAVSGSGP